MRCLVTAGPTFEPLDSVRRLTNLSTGRLGSELADHLAREGAEVILLLGELATATPSGAIAFLERFSTTADLQNRLLRYADSGIDAVFHAAAVSDFRPGTVWERDTAGTLRQRTERKFPSTAGTLLMELVPTPKILGRLRDLWPRALLVGWKYEVDGDRRVALQRALDQIRENRTNLSVANGPAYGTGFGVLEAGGACVHCADRPALYGELLGHLRPPPAAEPSSAGACS